jgi:flagellar hook protein FlgE
MIPAIEHAVAGLQTNLRLLDRAAGDVANVSTTGYRSATDRTRGGALLTTQNPLALAVQGNGWFRVALHNGSMFGEVIYTRSGDFHRDANGMVVTADGRYVIGYALDSTGRPTMTEIPIRIPDDTVAVTVGADGIVRATDGHGSQTALAAVSLARFPNTDGLAQAGSGLFRTTNASGPELAGAPGADGRGELVSGFLEMSNVDLTGSIVDTILASQGFAASAATFRTANDVVDELVRLGR